jgi:hypothetical protein
VLLSFPTSRGQGKNSEMEKEVPDNPDQAWRSGIRHGVIMTPRERWWRFPSP